MSGESILLKLVSLAFWRRVLAEGVGALFIVLLGCGSGARVDGAPPQPTVQVSLAFGLVVATMVWGLAHVSGGHVNPAVTAAAMVIRKVDILTGLLYMVAQCVGGIVGAAILLGVLPKNHLQPLGATVPSPHIDSGQAVAVELLITFVLVFTVFASCDRDRTDLAGSHALAIGLSVVVSHLFAVPLTGAGMNPARSLGPAAITQIWDQHWVYWVGPLAGGVLAGLMYQFIFAASASLEGLRKCCTWRYSVTKEISSNQKTEATEEVTDSMEMNQSADE